MQLQQVFLLQMGICRSLGAPGTTRPPHTCPCKGPVPLWLTVLQCLAAS